MGCTPTSLTLEQLRTGQCMIPQVFSLIRILTDSSLLDGIMWLLETYTRLPFFMFQWNVLCDEMGSRFFSCD